MKVHMLTGTNCEEFYLAFTAAVRRQNALIGIPFDCLLIPDAVGNYNAAWNYCEKYIICFARFQGQSFNYYSETLYKLLVQYVGTSGTGSNTVLRHTRLKNGRNLYLEINVNFKT